MLIKGIQPTYHFFRNFSILLQFDPNLTLYVKARAVEGAGPYDTSRIFSQCLHERAFSSRGRLI